MSTPLRSLTAALLLLWPLWCLAFDPVASTELVLNQTSIYCLDCHDGILATQIHQGHTVGSSYITAQMQSPTKLKPLGALDPTVHLKDGQIVCLTCHYPDSEHDSKLVMSNAGSRLCSACHNL
ncbi:MAG: hypothetical protein HY695_02040 [Deltaproteobacteria bacterium]|nr:hypothetical protein [Deltaproteobacteria bacterium]